MLVSFKNTKIRRNYFITSAKPNKILKQSKFQLIQHLL